LLQHKYITIDHNKNHPQKRILINVKKILAVITVTEYCYIHPKLVDGENKIHGCERLET